MMRHPHWPMRLDALLVAWRRRPFAWGSTDCGVLAASAIDALCGTSYAAHLIGAYQDEAGAHDWMAARNATTLVDVAECLTGNPRIAREGAACGDLLWYDVHSPIGALAVNYGGAVACLSPKGLRIVRAVRQPEVCIPVGAR